jgi:hypothetical protein
VGGWMDWWIVGWVGGWGEWVDGWMDGLAGRHMIGLVGMDGSTGA